MTAQPPAWAEDDPVAVARQLVEIGRRRPGWLGELLAALVPLGPVEQLARVQTVWQLSGGEMARLLGVSRRTLTRWCSAGLPAERVTAAADLGAATDLLLHYLQADRIPAVVRRPAAHLGGKSLIDVAATQGTAAAVAACRAMFDLREVGLMAV